MTPDPDDFTLAFTMRHPWGLVLVFLAGNIVGSVAMAVVQ